METSSEGRRLSLCLERLGRKPAASGVRTAAPTENIAAKQAKKEQLGIDWGRSQTEGGASPRAAFKTYPSVCHHTEDSPLHLQEDSLGGHCWTHTGL